MTVRIRFFALARQVVGREWVDIELPDTATVHHLRRALASSFPEISTLLDHAKFAIENEYAGNDTTLTGVTEVICIPPVSGG